MDNFQDYLLTFLIWLVSIILFRTIFTRVQSRFHHPPGPLALPVIGHFHLLRPPLHRALYKLSTRYGPLIRIYFGSIPYCVVSSAEIAKEIFKSHEIFFCNRPLTIAISYLTYDAADFGFAPYGTYWKFIKKLCMSELLNGRMLDQLLPIRQEEINQFLQIVHQKAELGEAVDVGGEILRLMNSIIMRMTIGKSCFSTEDEVHEVTKRVKAGSALTGEFNLQDYFWFCKKLDLQGFGKKLKRVRDDIDALLETIIQDHKEARKTSTREEGTSKDILDHLLSISEDESSEVKLSRENIKAFLVDIFIGGTGSTAATIEWSLAELINHPTIMEKARKEIDSVIGKDRIVIESDIASLPFLQAVVKETLRLHPPNPLIMRESSQNCTIGAYDIPSNTPVFINVWAIGKDPMYWDDPLEFCPERFLNINESGKLDVRGQNYALLPFGSGRRGCPGASLALNVVHTTLAAMIQCFEWKDRVGQNSNVDMEEATAITVARAHPLICLPVLRLFPFPPLSC